MALEKKLLDELIAIKKLLIFQLLNNGANATDIGETLGLTQQRISQMIPVRKIKKGRKP